MFSCATKASEWVEFPFLLFLDNSLGSRLNIHVSPTSVSMEAKNCQAVHRNCGEFSKEVELIEY